MDRENFDELIWHFRGYCRVAVGQVSDKVNQVTEGYYASVSG